MRPVVTQPTIAGPSLLSGRQPALTHAGALTALAILMTSAPPVRAADAQEHGVTEEAISIQRARAARVKARGEKRHYEKQWDLSGIPAYQPKVQVTGTLRIAGLNYLTDGNLAKYFEEGFKRFHPNATLQWNTPTGLVAIPALYFGLAEVGANRKIVFDEVLAFQRMKGYHPTEINYVTGSYNVPGWAPSVGIFVHKSNPISRLSFRQLDGIFGAERAGGFEGVTWNADAARGPETNIRTWGQAGLKGKWANMEVHPYGRPLKYHQQLRLERLVFKGGSKWTEKLREFAHDAAPDGKALTSTVSMLDALAADPAGIAFADLAASENNPNVKLVAIAARDEGPYVLPTLETSRDRTYPLHGESYFYIDRPPGQPVNPYVREFLNFVLSREGQEAVQRDGKFLPLSPELAARERAKLD